MASRALQSGPAGLVLWAPWLWQWAVGSGQRAGRSRRTAGAEVVTAPAAADTFRPPGVVVVDLLAVRPSPNVDQ